SERLAHRPRYGVEIGARDAEIEQVNLLAPILELIFDPEYIAMGERGRADTHRIARPDRHVQDLVLVKPMRGAAWGEDNKRRKGDHETIHKHLQLLAWSERRKEAGSYPSPGCSEHVKDVVDRPRWHSVAGGNGDDTVPRVYKIEGLSSF